MTTVLSYSFDDRTLASHLATVSQVELDDLEFGLIGFDLETRVCRYNTLESRLAGLAPERVLGLSLFTHVAPCMNNFLVAQRFEDALTKGTPLDVVIDYVLTLRMKPTKVKLRLLAVPGALVRYVLVERRDRHE